MTPLYIALAGAAGSLGRHYVAVGLRHAGGDRYPWGTFAVNFVGSFAIGLVMAAFLARGELDSRLRVAITTGFLGGFTTYSAFAFETVTFVERREIGLAVTYVVTTLLVAGLAAWAGIALGRRI